jgi:hypothetical protein
MAKNPKTEHEKLKKLIEEIAQQARKTELPVVRLMNMPARRIAQSSDPGCSCCCC